MLINFTQAVDKIAPTRARRTVRIADLVEPWCVARRADGYRESGVERYRNQVLAFARWAGGEAATTELNEARIRAYKVELGSRVAPGTTHNALTALRTFGAWCVQEGHLACNEAMRVSLPRVVDPPPNPLSRAEIAQLLAALDAPQYTHRLTWRRNRRAVLLMLYAGLRRTEAAKALWGDIDLARREIIVRYGKGGKSRVVAVCDELAEELYARGEDIITIQRLLGHADPKTTIRYIGASSEKEHKAVSKLTFRADLRT